MLECKASLHCKFQDFIMIYENYNLPWTQLSIEINKKYKVLSTYDLNFYDGQMELLYVDLEKFKNYEFLNNERLVFYHFETNFYLNGVSLQLYNLQLILNYFNIPRCFCLMLTAHYGVDKEIHQLENQLSTDSTRMKVVTSSYFYILSNPSPSKNPENNFEQIEYPYICLNGTERNHRLMFLCLLSDAKILDKGLISYHFSKSNPKNLLESTKTVELTTPIFFVKTTPFIRINEQISWCNSIKYAYHRWHLMFKNKSYANPELSNYITSCNVDDHFKKSFLYVITETVFDYPHQFITEKIFKAFINRRPFVIVGPTGTIKKLNELGFKTFSPFIDESYDNLSDPNERLLAIVNIVSKFCEYSTKELQKLALNMSDVIEYNYQYYFKNYCVDDLNKKLKEL